MKKVVLSQTIHPDGMAALAEAPVHLVALQSDRPTSRETLAANMADCDILISMPGDCIDRALIEAAPKLKLIAQHAVGYDNIDTDAAAERGIVVTNTPGAVTEATAEMTFALMLAVARRIGEGETLLRNGLFFGWHPMQLLGIDLFGATLGIVGYGRIGRAVAQRAEAFGMKVVYHGRDNGMPLDALLGRSDIVSLHCPLNRETHHLMNRTRLAQMKQGALLINTARGPIIDESALVEALEQNHLGGVGLDVFEREPKVHPGLLNFRNVVATPHQGTSTWGTRKRMASRVMDNVSAFLAGKKPPNQVV
ncbi:2-hydroxyacid dehydrogenase [Acanthopleuribacter pedis]|uniref:D-glycerate dehydrogenase n=1 Tax=Acanthopleuribacter pedis TaxID=442870 RepID=A0A8J7Q7M3_9BACT|nr:D-glycerate dehydrogenase [Acanthopleuribacter pedis]MBO1319197.1 D-glycerate dehydrogenase [Acanthopleuribacter pedis]